MALAKLDERAMFMRASITKEAKSNPEELALQEFVTQLKGKNLTPESFFRLCDGQYKKEVKATHFRSKLKKMGLRLTDTQVRRITLIFDEDMSGAISFAEYQNALEAFKLDCEPHIDCEGSSGVYRSFKVRTMEYLVKVLYKNDWTPQTLFDQCNKDGSVSIDLDELKAVIS